MSAVGGDCTQAGSEGEEAEREARLNEAKEQGHEPNDEELQQEGKEKEELPPLYTPDPRPSPLYCGFYSQLGAFWLSMGFQSLLVSPESYVSPCVTVNPHAPFEAVKKVLSDLRERLETMSKGIAKMSEKTKSKFAGGNPVCPRPTPTWQKGIGDFFGGPGWKPEKENQLPQSDDEEAGGSGVSKASKKSRPLPGEDDDE
ncbi:unnamed protein product [Coregonus sp. 'balchen']|nr:unnamed protein product [Coregonus sp. 'balchen']